MQIGNVRNCTFPGRTVQVETPGHPTDPAIQHWHGIDFALQNTAAFLHRVQNSCHLSCVRQCTDGGLDRIQDKLVNAAGFNEAEVLRVCRLAPLTARRDMAMLGLIHRTVLGKGPCHFRAFFKPDIHKRQAGSGRHRLQLCEYDVHESDLQFPGSRPADYLQISALGLVQVYNSLPAGIVENSSSVSSFQSALQGVLMARATAGCTDWKFTFSPRVPMHRHPLRIL